MIEGWNKKLANWVEGEPEEMFRHCGEPAKMIMHFSDSDKVPVCFAHEHRPDTEGEMWDEDDYLVEFDELPAELEDHIGVNGCSMSVPESWIHREDERDV